MKSLRKGQTICNMLYRLKPSKSTHKMGLLEFEEYIDSHKAQLFDLLMNISDEDFDREILL